MGKSRMMSRQAILFCLIAGLLITAIVWIILADRHSPCGKGVPQSEETPAAGFTPCDE